MEDLGKIPPCPSPLLITHSFEQHSVKSWDFSEGSSYMIGDAVVNHHDMHLPSVSPCFRHPQASGRVLTSLLKINLKRFLTLFPSPLPGLYTFVRQFAPKRDHPVAS